MPAFQPFEMERLQSTWEKLVEYNLSESGVHPLRLGELLAAGSATAEDLLATELGYPQTNGAVELRQNIAALYAGATPENVLVTVGCAEANAVALQTLLSPGDEMVVMLPNYMQTWGLGHNLGAEVKTFHLREDRGWAPDLEELSAVVSPRTKLIAVCNPDNPTGYILTAAEMGAIVDIARRAGAWLLADEVYAGAERLTDVETPTFWGRYDKVLAMNSMSKAYGLPGLRVGWVVGPADMVEQLWARHDYTSICVTMLANKLTAIALSPAVRPHLIQRARDYIRRGYPILDGWLEGHEGVFSLVPPQAAAIAFVRYHLDVNSTELVYRLIREKSVLIVPGDHFGMDRFLRIGYGLQPGYLRSALDRVHDLLTEIRG